MKWGVFESINNTGLKLKVKFLSKAWLVGYGSNSRHSRFKRCSRQPGSEFGGCGKSRNSGGFLFVVIFGRRPNTFGRADVVVSAVDVGCWQLAESLANECPELNKAPET